MYTEALVHLETKTVEEIICAVIPVSDTDNFSSSGKTEVCPSLLIFLVFVSIFFIHIFDMYLQGSCYVLDILLLAGVQEYRILEDSITALMELTV